MVKQLFNKQSWQSYIAVNQRFSFIHCGFFMGIKIGNFYHRLAYLFV